MNLQSEICSGEPFHSFWAKYPAPALLNDGDAASILSADSSISEGDEKFLFPVSRTDTTAAQMISLIEKINVCLFIRRHVALSYRAERSNPFLLDY